MLLEVKNIEVCINDYTLLKDISFCLKQGEVVGLFGSNGAGKTTLLNALSRFINVNKGEIILNGIIINNLKPHKLANMQVCRTFQQVKNWESLNVYDNLFLSSDKIHSKRSERVFNLFKLFEVEYLLANRTKKLIEFSIGEQRIIELIRAFSFNAKLVLMDEPSVGLSLKTKNILINYIKNNVDKVGILLISHDLNFMKETVDKVLFMEGGEIIKMGTFNDVVNNTNVIESYFGNIKG